MRLITRTYTIILLALLIFNCSNNDDTSVEMQALELTVTDADGNVYNTITIGNQVWMLENLKTTSYNDGTPITEYTFEDFGNNWGSINNQIGHYQWASTFDLNNVYEEDLPFDYYGAMYNHFAVESGKLAPEGWRIPSEADFIALENYLSNNGFDGNIAEVLKSETGWLSSSENGTNASAFNGLPNGYISGFGTATASELTCSWLTSDVSDNNATSSTTRRWVQLNDNSTIFYSDTSIALGAAIRCIKE